MQRLPTLSKRLEEAASFVKKDEIIADIGTDHALLPIFLLLSGVCEKAYACDINEGPCERAKANALRYGVEKKIKISRRDGMSGLKNEGINKFIILGMGGELIVKILAGEDVPNGTRFILGPNTKQDTLRKYLTENGYEINDEKIIFSDEKYYQIISAEKNGVCDRLSCGELKYGKINIERRTPVFLDYVKKTHGELLRAREMRLAAGINTHDPLLYESEMILKN